MKGVYTDMNTVYTELFQKLLHEKRFAELSKAASILHPDRGDLVIEEYDGDAPRLFKRNVETYVLCPYKLDVVQESGISRAIETGEIFDDADRVENHADFLQKTIMPMNAMANHGCCEPKKMKIVISGVIGKIGPDGSVSLDTTDMDNGAACIKDLMGCRPGEIESTCDRHLGLTPHEHPMGHAHGPMEYDHTSLPLDVRRDIHDVTKEIDDLLDVSDLSEDELNFDDLEDVEWDDDDDDDDEEHDENKEYDEDDDDENVQEAARTTKRRWKESFLGSLIGVGMLVGLDVLFGVPLTVLEALAVVGVATPLSFTLSNVFSSSHELVKVSNEVLQLISEISETLISDPSNDERTLKQLKKNVRNLRTECGYLMNQVHSRREFNAVKKLALESEAFYGTLKHDYGKIDPKLVTKFIEAMQEAAEVITGKPLKDIGKEEAVSEAVTIMRQPKRLKTLGREIIGYVPTQIMQVQDTHDQMVLAGYVSSQLEKVDFYLNCLDVDDGRYIVPHDKQYLLQMQKDLTDLLQRILRLNPIVKYDRIWKPGIGGVR